MCRPKNEQWEGETKHTTLLVDHKWVVSHGDKALKALKEAALAHPLYLDYYFSAATLEHGFVFQAMPDQPIHIEGLEPKGFIE